MGHGQAFTAVYAERRIYGISPSTGLDVSDQQLFNVAPVATIMETMFNMGLHAISGCRSWKP
eukprot:1730702-Pleurochrysis_carterae.AAC.1